MPQGLYRGWGPQCHQNNTAKLRTSLFFFITQMLVEGTQFLTPISTQVFVSREVRHKCIPEEQTHRSHSRKDGERQAVLLCNVTQLHLSAEQITLKQHSLAFICTVRRAKEEKEKIKSNSSPHSWQPGSPPGLWPGFLQFPGNVSLLSCLSITPALSVAFCVLHLLIPTLRISLPFLSPLYFSVISCKMRFYEK